MPAKPDIGEPRDGNLRDSRGDTIPIINRSVVWWKSLHQGPSITMKGSTIAPELLWPLGLTTLGFSLLFGAIVLMRMRANLAEAKVEARLRRLASA